MQTKKLVFMGIYLFGSLGLGGEYQAATSTDNEGTSSITAQLDSTFQEEQVDSIEKAKLFTNEGEETDITFKDSTLENEVKKELNLTENEHVTTVNILNLRKLVSSGSGITNLTGLEYAKNLMLITFNDNQIRLPQVALGQKTILNLLDKDNNFPSTINFNTPGEISTSHPLKTNYVQWHQVGENSLEFSSSDDTFSGSVNQLVIK